MTARLASWRNARVRYPYAGRDAVGPISLDLLAGERVLLLGPSGCGKSTRLQTLTGIIPASIPAEVGGAVRLCGASVDSRPPSGWATTIGQLFQDADQTLCGFRVEDEIAFSLENSAVCAAGMSERISRIMARVGLPEAWRERRIATLSGGEKQMVALAATLVQEAPIFVADEPTASLAPAVAARIDDLLLGAPGPGAVLIVDHRLDRMIGGIDRVAVLGDNGALIAQGPPAELFRRHGRMLDELGIWTPLASRFDRALESAGLDQASAVLAVNDLLARLAVLPEARQREAASVIRSVAVPLQRQEIQPAGKVVARLSHADCAPLFGPVILRGISLEIRAGKILGIIGPNGAGKSTLGASLAGLLRLKAGKRDGPPGCIAFQNPENHFTRTTVREELGAMTDRQDRDDILKDWGLLDVAAQHPFELSQGQKRRLVLAGLTASDRWPLLVLDEPTSGLDARGCDAIARHVQSIAARDRAVAVITHDMDFALRVCDRVALVLDGALHCTGTAEEVLRNRPLLERAGLALPTLAPMLDWLAARPC